ncbi:hypothetical protein VAA_04280 [Vibrio anguillarum 775]|nr:hypothetical protein VAA_04280 [Vibrio anguillarum 775]
MSISFGFGGEQPGVLPPSFFILEKFLVFWG